MWVRTQSDGLVNLDNVVSVQKKEDRNSKQFAVFAMDTSEEGSWRLANRLSEDEADQLIARLWSSVAAGSIDLGAE